MADNEVVIHVRSDNNTRPGFDAAKRDAAAAGDDAGKSFAGSFMSRIGHMFTGSGQGTVSGALSGIPGVGGALGAAGPYGLPILAAGVATLLPEIVGLASGLAAATTGVAVFGAVARPTISSLQTGLATLSTATGNYQTASANLNTAIQQSPADLKAYQAVLQGLEPDLAAAAVLLTNQDITWQNLTPSQQASEIALRNNSAAYKTLLPSQKDALNALINEANAWNNLTPAQQTASVALGKVGDAWTKLTTAMAPLVLKVVGAGAGIASTLIPDLKPFATDAGNAIDGLLVHVNKFFQSADFKGWLAKFEPIVGPAITAIGSGIGQLAATFGKLLTVLPPADVVRAIHIAFDLLNYSLLVLTGTVQKLMAPLSALASLVTWLGGTPLGGGGGNTAALGAPGVTSLQGRNFSGLSALKPGAPIGSFVPAGGGPSGSKIGHLAGGGYGSGWTVVGENGPELLKLPGGSYVTPASQLQGGGGGQLQISMAPGSGNQWERLMLQSIRLLVLKNGGGGPQSVQIAFGQVH